jgi:Fe-S cluster assembly protein SufB
MTQTQDPTAAFVGTGQTQDQHLAALGRYEYGWADTDVAGASARAWAAETPGSAAARRSR